MKLIIATLLVASVAAVAQAANEYKTPGDCTKNLIFSGSSCDNCCKKFDQVGVEGRRSLLPGADFNLCKCITKEEEAKRDAEFRAQWEKEHEGPRYKSIGQCSNIIGPSSPCTECCKTFGQIGVEGRHSWLPGADFHLCKCITKEEEAKREAQWRAQWEKEQRAKGRTV